ncbi:PREDICTED: two pore potassium channel protein sup-9-like [Priapulus caudatus]|uniref:Two pore potassium channel protein sup-9-like n=1 Tax=Priapulus caudatus TaxID=37621 RepID=A0ABM1ED96_PRICU|nr:PREDICTED: two pore potassium channel protein sup-9-like [Priapulus caudatus]
MPLPAPRHRFASTHARAACARTGYGHSTPTTYAGKLFCMGYALTGIPLTLVMFQAIGERLNTFVAFTIIHLKRCMKLRSTEVSQTNLIIVGLGLCAIVTTGGAFMFSFYERWSYFDSLYYCLITLTTIGFGDYVALQNSETTEQNPYYIVLSLVFIFTGLTVVGAAMNLLVLRFLTMNTEDEKREEAEAQAAAQIAVRLDGDVITANGSIISGGGGGGELATDYSDAASTCSCSCYGRTAGKQTRYKVTRSPGRISHLLQMQTFRSREDVYSTIQDCGDEPQSPTRASV